MQTTKMVILSLSAVMLFNANMLGAEVQNKEENVVTIEMPKVPDVPKVEAVVPTAVTVQVLSNENNQSNEDLEKMLAPKEKVHFSDHVAPAKYAIIKDANATAKKIEAGDIENGRVAAYLHAPLITAEQVKANLEKAGFTVLAEYKIDEKGEIQSIVFSDKAMEESANKKGRGFASTLRIVIDKQNELINISNPIYVMKAFMQEEYDSKLAEGVLKRLRESFEGLSNSKEIVKFSVLEHYQFMENMPFYQDMQVIATGNNEELLSKAKASKSVVYEQHLSNGSIVVGVELGKRTSKFVKKIGYLNSGLLPYPVLIENGEAKILEPRFYIAVMYPMLQMSEFMTIATIPGAIASDCDKMFR